MFSFSVELAILVSIFWIEGGFKSNLTAISDFFS